MIYMTDENTVEQAIVTARASLLEVCKQYGAEHQAYWYLLDSGKYENRDDYRAKHHWRRVKALQKRIKEQGQAEGVDGFAFYSANFGD
jgi:hypothetical protein